MQEKRYIQVPILEDLQKKMVFLAGPRQVGKTTLAKSIAAKQAASAYYSWDQREDRLSLLKGQWPPGKALLVFDELHKYRKWKQWIKGEYDKYHDRLSFLVTGSARLDVYRRGGDSLQGRYHHYRLHPFSLNELIHSLKTPTPFQALSFSSKGYRDELEMLLQYSGFPEPVLAQSPKEHRRWQKERLERFFREDVRDLENVRDLSHLQLLADLLPQRIGSLLSLNSLREDLEVSHKAISHWIDIFERLYFIFRVRPYATQLARSLKKEPKAYLWDWTLVADKGARFENLIASHLLKFCHYLEDTEGYPIQLHYLRDLAKREVDFLVTVHKKPWFAVEAKLSGDKIDPTLHYFKERLHIPFLYQVVCHTEREFVEEGVHLLSADKFLTGLV